MSEELENSLQQAVETYLNERLRPINERLAHLQAEFSEAVARLNELSQTQSLEGTALSAAIFAHLQTARGQRLSGAMIAPAHVADAGTIKRAVADIEGQQSQTDILKALLAGSAQFAERVAMFIVKNDQAIGWRMATANDPTNSQPIGGVSLPLSSNTGLTKAIHAQATWSGSARESNEDQLLLDQLGGSAESAAAIPLVVRGKVVAALYADAVSSEAGAINTDALEVLARVAAMTVNVVSIHRSAAVPKREAAAQGPAAEATPSVAEPAAPVEAAPTYTPQVEAQVEEAPAPSAEVAPQAPAAIETRAVEIAEAPQAEIATEPETLTGTPLAETLPEIVVASEPSETSAIEAPAPEAPATVEAEAPPVQAAQPEPPAPPQPQAPPPSASEPAFVSSYSAPLGSARRYGVSEPELPIEVGEEERRLHNDARRFARLLVSEIKLYTENQVKEGRSNADLYDRLRDDIDRSRQMYDKRVAPPVAARHDYFHQELVNTLAEGDVAKLGGSYPGAVMNSN